MQIELEELKTLLCNRQAAQPEQKSERWEIGKKYFFRTVTHHHAGVLLEVTPHEIWIEKAAWIASDGRLTEALAKGSFEEVEMFPSTPVAIGRGSLIDACQIVDIPLSQK